MKDKNKTKSFLISIGIIFCLLLFIFVFSFKSASAGAIETAVNVVGNSMLGNIEDIFASVLITTQGILGLLVEFGAYLLQVVIDINIGVLRVSTLTIAMTGWQVFRQIANLGFVLGIIIIAVATILRNRSYQAQQILWKLIVAALLVNFSLVIAGLFIDTSDVFSKYFINEIKTRSGADIGKNIVGYINPAGVTGAVIDQNKFDAAIKKLNTKAESKYFVLVGSLISDVVLIIILVTLWVLVAQIFIRTFYVLALLTISPIVWLAWVFPWGKRHWTNWWEHFIKWIFMLPINLLFIWIALSIMKSTQAISVEVVEKYITENGGDAALGALSVMIAPIISPMMGVALLIMGMKIASRMGIYGSDAALKTATNVGNWAKGKASEYGGRAGARALTQTGLMEKTQGKLTSLGSTKWGKRLGFGKVAQQFTLAQTKVEKVSQGNIEEKKKELNNLNSKRIAQLLPTMSVEDRASALEILSSRGDFSEAADKIGSLNEVIESIERMQQLGRGKEASGLQKQMGMSLAMMRAIVSGGSFDGKSLQELSDEYYGKFTPEDWKKVASGIGNAIFDPSKKPLPGMTADQTDMFRSAYIRGLISDEQSIGVTAPKLKRNQLRNFYIQILSSVGGGKLGSGKINKEFEEEKDVNAEELTGLLDASGKPQTRTVTTKKKIIGTREVYVDDLDQELELAIESGNFDRAEEIVEASSNREAKAVIKKLRKSIGSHAISGGEDEGKEEKKESPPASGAKDKK